MTQEIPKYVLRAYALLYTKYGTENRFTQDTLNWVVSSSMRKKIFSVLLNSGWIVKTSKREYMCNDPKTIFSSLFLFKIPEILKTSKKKYYFCKMSAVEIWTDFSYIQRSWEHSPYFIYINKEDLNYWKGFLSKFNMPFFIEEGSFIGEFVILMPRKRLICTTYNHFPVEKLSSCVKFCKNNSLFEYPLAYLKEKFKLKINVKKELIQQVKEAI
ncbi:hypothetical protein HY636_06470 [Candidatus Woesearchaeota archaeon]|nr:hypothetical protein [Candidatus Woesearchaeota archaeon]